MTTMSKTKTKTSPSKSPRRPRRLRRRVRLSIRRQTTSAACPYATDRKSMHRTVYDCAFLSFTLEENNTTLVLLLLLLIIAPTSTAALLLSHILTPKCTPKMLHFSFALERTPPIYHHLFRSAKERTTDTLSSSSSWVNGETSRWVRAVRQPRRTRERRTTSVESAAVGFIQFII